MERDTGITVRQNWEKASAERQTKINELLSDLQPEIDLINLNLATLISESRYEAAQDYGKDAVEYLNERWQKYSGDAFLISGKMVIPEVAASIYGVKCEPELAEHCVAAYNRGFTISPVQHSASANDHPTDHKVGMVFELSAQGQIDTPWLQASFRPRIFAQPHEISLQYLRPYSAEAVSSDVDEVKESIVRADALLQLYLKSQDSNFYQISGRKQEKFIQSIIDSVNDVLPSPETNDFVKVTNAETEELFIKGFQEDQGTTKFIDPFVPFLVNGVIRGVTVLELPEKKGAQIKSVDDLDDSSLGLSLIVSPEDINHEIAGYQNQDVIIPLSQLKTANFELV